MRRKLFDVSGLGGIKRLMKTPKPKKTPAKSPDLRGVRKLMATPKRAKTPKKTPSMLGAKMMFSTPQTEKVLVGMKYGMSVF